MNRKRSAKLDGASEIRKNDNNNNKLNDKIKNNKQQQQNGRIWKIVAFVFFTEISYSVCQKILYYGENKFPYAWFSTFLQCVFYGVVSGAQFYYSNGHLPSFNQKGFPGYSHLMIGGASLISRATGNFAFKYMDYSLKVLFTSANPIIVLITGVFYKQTYSLVQYLSTFLLALGLSIFSYADINIGEGFSIYGILLMIISVSMDAVKMRSQEKILKKHTLSEAEVTFWSSCIGIIGSFIFVLVYGQLFLSLNFIYERPMSLVWMLLIFTFGYVASIATLTLMMASDAFVASFISTVRKALTVFISFFAFQKQFTTQHIIAIFIFFTGIMWNTLSKRKLKK